MNIFFNSKKEPEKKARSVGLILYCFFGFLVVGFSLWYVLDRFLPPPPLPLPSIEAPVSEPGVIISIHAFSVVEELAMAYGVPAGPMGRLSKYLEDNAFNAKYGGIGLFSVKPSHLGWLKDSVLADTQIDLEDPIQNTQVAAFLLKRFHDSGYSWRNCFLIYAFGFSEVNSTNHLDFLDYVFKGEE